MEIIFSLFSIDCVLLFYSKVNDLKAAVAAEVAVKERELEEAKLRRRVRQAAAAEAHARGSKAKK